MSAILITIVLFLLPGGIVFFVPSLFPRLLRVERLPVAISLSLAYWIISFFMLSVIPIPLSIFVYGSLIISGIVCLYLLLRGKAGPVLFMARSLTIVALLAIVCSPLVIAASGLIAPPGADMSMHAYYAKLITITNGFPKTGYPIIPTDQFGKYPVGFSVLIADMMLVNGLPVYTNATWLTMFTYMFFTAALYFLLRGRYSSEVSMTTAAILTWAAKTPLDFFPWGGNPTILSLSMLLIAGGAFLHESNRWNIWIILLSAYAALLTHYIPFVSAAYLTVFLLPLLGPRIKLVLGNWRTAIPVSISLVVFTAPFVFRLFNPPFIPSDASRSFVAALHREEIREWTGSPALTPIVGPLLFLINTYGLPVVLLYLASLIISSKRTLMLHMTLLIPVIFLITNSEHWWLPFSEVLYPKRIALFWVIPLGLGIGLGLTRATQLILPQENRRIRYAPFLAQAVPLLAALMLMFPTIKRTVSDTNDAANLSVVTADDLAAMRWLDRHTTQYDVILNNYQDAGLWIPAIANRTITLYHTNPIDMDSLAITRGRETYAFIGSTSLTMPPEVDPVNEQSLTRMQTAAKKVFGQGRAAVYRMDFPR